MASPPVGFLEATFIFRVTGVAKDMTWALGLTSATFGTTSPNAMASEIQSLTASTGKIFAPAGMSNEWTYAGVSVTKMVDTGPLIGQFLNNVVGTIASPSLPPNCSALVRKVTTAGGRRNRGRAYVPLCFTGEGFVDQAGFITPATITAMNTKFNLMLSDLNTAGYQPVLFHTQPPYTPTPVSSLVLQAQIATQRRRLR